VFSLPKIKPIYVFYVVIAYVLTAFIWWTVLHLRSNTEWFNQQVEIIEFKHQTTVSETVEYQNVQEKYQRKNWMIYGEAGVFFIMLLVGSFWIIRGFKKEEKINQQQQNFLLSVTHELKSPLASMQLGMETLQKRKLVEGIGNKILNNNIADINRLKTLIDNILVSTSLDNKNYYLNISDVDLPYLLEKIATRFNALPANKNRIKILSSPNYIIKADEMALDSAIANLVENALKYSNDIVEISLEQLNNTTKIIVSDKGEGINKSAQKDIFKKFNRLGNEMTRKTKGTGLGLFIANQLVKLHNGYINIENNKPKGSRFVIYLPY